MIMASEILATYATTLRIEQCDRKRVNVSYWKVADSIVDKAAVTLSTFGKGQVLLLGPHPELCSPVEQKALANLVAAVCEANEEGSTPTKKRRTSK